MLARTRERLKDQEWSFSSDANGKYSNEVAMLACLMDIRDELKRLNSLLHCNNFMMIPHKLDRIARNTVKPRRRRKP